MNPNEKISGADIKTESPFLRRVENFWYHYKWPTIIIGFFLVVFLVCTLQMCGREEKDVTVIYAGPVQLSDSELKSVADVIAGVMPDELKEGEGKKISALNYQIYSREQIEKIEAETDKSGVSGYVDRSYNSKNNENFYNYIQTGESSICFLDPELYESLKGSDRLMQLSSVLGYEFEGSEDGYGVKLGDTDIYDDYGVMRLLPEDTVVCILRPLVVGKNSEEEEYDLEKKVFASIIEYYSDEK